MTTWFLTLIIVCLAWIALWFVRLRPLWCRPLPDIKGPVPGESLSCIIPARNEEKTLPVLLQSLKQHCPGAMEIIGADDASSDRTALCVRAARKQDERVRLLSCPPKPDGWTGKTWALAQGAQAAGGAWLVFCDADVVVRRDAIRPALNIMAHEKLDCLSLVPAMRSPLLPVAALLACFAVARALFLRPAGPRCPGLVQGAFLVIRRRVYEAVGGHRHIKGLLLEDVGMGRLLYGAGCRVRTYPAPALIDTMMYGSFAAAFEGIARHIYPVMGSSIARILAAAGACTALVIFPVGSLAAALLAARAGFHVRPAVIGSALAATILMYAIVSQILARERFPVIAKLMVPLNFFLFAAVMGQSIRAYARGAVRWKERLYCPGNAGETAGVRAASPPGVVPRIPGHA